MYCRTALFFLYISNAEEIMKDESPPITNRKKKKASGRRAKNLQNKVFNRQAQPNKWLWQSVINVKGKVMRLI